MLYPAALLCTKFEFIPGSWRLMLSPHTVRSPHPTEGGCCRESQCIAVMCLWKQWQEDGPWDRPGTGLFRKYNSVGKRSASFTLPGLTANPVTTMLWPENFCLGCEEPCKSHIMTILSREALKNWPDLWIQAICSRKKSSSVFVSLDLKMGKRAGDKKKSWR